MTINCRGRLLDVSHPVIMGILNVTPDSFFDGGQYLSDSAILDRAQKLLDEGASIIDIGGYSSRPGAADVPVEEETDRVCRAISAIMTRFPEAVLSVDTFRSAVARTAIETGASIINDISAGHLDPDMLQTVAGLQVPYVMMHMRGTPSTMASMTDYDDVTVNVLRYFSERIAAARSLGINDLILDPGFGFAKTLEQNYELLRHLDVFRNTGLPVLAGVSRKSMIYKPLGIKAESAMNGTTALHMAALERGASILRVHDVAAAAECIALFRCLRGA